MKILVTGSAGHLGEALVRRLSAASHEVVGLDIKPSSWTRAVGSITKPGFINQAMKGVEAVIHAATLHKPHVATHSRQAFINTNINGTLNLLEAAVQHGVKSFVFTSTTSVFGDAMRPGPGEPAVWVTENLPAQPKNIYGVTKLCAEGLCRMFSRNHRLACIVLRTSRFFPEDDDNRHKRQAFDDDNLKVNELLFRRADIADMVAAHERAIEKAPELGFGTFIISATSPFRRQDAPGLGRDAPVVLQRYFPEYRDIYQALGWKMFASIGRVYDNRSARETLGWAPEHGFGGAIASLKAGKDYRSELACQVGAKGYHDETFEDGPYPVEDNPSIEAGHDR
ncbi:MAG: NAD(P)-dependent oxidoreductase [Gammaproteobacteria bacterium]|nr:NAD(P)-dependent oxidoreductase [Gammaproteobacteria bacterium]NNE04926.1 NAD(P)-dependent oxidoreductase [Xanthomonadales bacterium]